MGDRIEAMWRGQWLKCEVFAAKSDGTRYEVRWDDDGTYSESIPERMRDRISPREPVESSASPQSQRPVDQARERINNNRGQSESRLRELQLNAKIDRDGAISRLQNTINALNNKLKENRVQKTKIEGDIDFLKTSKHKAAFQRSQISMK